MNFESFQDALKLQKLAIAEECSWLGMPFVGVSAKGTNIQWVLGRQIDYFEARHRGVCFALRMIEHLRQHHDYERLDITWRLSDVIAGFGRPGEWSGAEHAFLQSLASYIAAGKVDEGGETDLGALT